MTCTIASSSDGNDPKIEINSALSHLSHGKQFQKLRASYERSRRVSAPLEDGYNSCPPSTRGTKGTKDRDF